MIKTKGNPLFTQEYLLISKRPEASHDCLRNRGIRIPGTAKFGLANRITIAPFRFGGKI